jgi:hypothetical protein
MSENHDDEKMYWENYGNMWHEEEKQYVYARYMGIQQTAHHFLLNNVSVIDIGGGPSSMLLKCYGLTKGLVCDPLDYPYWTKLRYRDKNIDTYVMRGEDLDELGWDEAWIYNCLQHTDEPELIISNAKRAAKKLRIFEWVNTPPDHMHPRVLTKDLLDAWIENGAESISKTVRLGESGCYGEAYYGVFER